MTSLSCRESPELSLRAFCAFRRLSLASAACAFAMAASARAFATSASAALNSTSVELEL